MNVFYHKVHSKQQEKMKLSWRLKIRPKRTRLVSLKSFWISVRSNRCQEFYTESFLILLQCEHAYYVARLFCEHMGRGWDITPNILQHIGLDEKLRVTTTKRGTDNHTAYYPGNAIFYKLLREILGHISNQPHLALELLPKSYIDSLFNDEKCYEPWQWLKCLKGVYERQLKWFEQHEHIPDLAKLLVCGKPLPIRRHSIWIVCGICFSIVAALIVCVSVMLMRDPQTNGSQSFVAGYHSKTQGSPREFSAFQNNTERFSKDISENGYSLLPVIKKSTTGQILQNETSHLESNFYDNSTSHVPQRDLKTGPPQLSSMSTAVPEVDVANSDRTESQVSPDFTSPVLVSQDRKASRTTEQSTFTFEMTTGPEPNGISMEFITSHSNDPTQLKKSHTLPDEFPPSQSTRDIPPKISREPSRTNKVSSKIEVNMSDSIEVNSPKERGPISSLPRLLDQVVVQDDINIVWIVRTDPNFALITIQREGLQAEIRFRKIGPDSYVRGSNRRPGEQSTDPIEIDTFYLAQTEFTEWQMYVLFQDFLSTKPYSLSKIPLTKVSWNEAQQVCHQLSKILGKQVKEVRLPWEYEWEYAASAGLQSAKCSLEELAWLGENPMTARPHPVAAKPPDGLGIYDMMGNIEEWVQDYYSERAYLLPSKAGPSTGTKRVFRGGSCITPIKTLYPARRFSAFPTTRSSLRGFRIVVIP